MNITEFKKQAKELAVKFGFKKSDVSITTKDWLRISVKCEDSALFVTLKKELEKLAGYQDKSDVMTDYFDYRVAVKNKYNGSFGGLLITRF